MDSLVQMASSANGDGHPAMPAKVSRKCFMAAVTDPGPKNNLCLTPGHHRGNYKSAALIRSGTRVHFANKNERPGPTATNPALLSALMSSQLYSSVDFGRKWQLIHEHVTPNRFYW